MKRGYDMENEYKRMPQAPYLCLFLILCLLTSLISQAGTIASISSEPSPQAGSITVLTPNGFENWQRGRWYTITWSSSGAGSDVDIELYKGGIYDSTIISNTPNDGSYSWNTPSNLNLDMDYTIKIISTSDNSIYDFSDSDFYIGLYLLEFSGYTWYAKDSNEATFGPGGNYYSSSPENLWLDVDGQLHMKLTYRNGKWYCPEIYSQDHFGYGKYVFFVSSRIDQLNENIIVGLFTYMDDNNEIDIEFAKWGDPEYENSQYVVQPGQTPGNYISFNTQLNTINSTHTINWQMD
jgi:hypothetical protein